MTQSVAPPAKSHAENATHSFVTPAKAGVQGGMAPSFALDSRFRGNDEEGCGNNGGESGQGTRASGERQGSPQETRLHTHGQPPRQTSTHPAGLGWVPLSRDLGIPSEHGVEDPVAALGHGAVFTRERRIRFLDHLAMKGNVRAAALRVGVSHETAYRARRQDAAFAALWDAALVHARSYAEQVLATRALDGVEVPIVYHGEVLGHQVRHDPRLLLAHIARLDRHAEENLDAVERAGRFDELLATYAGHPAPPDFAQAAEEAHGWNDQAAPDLPPTRRDYVVWRRSEEIGGSDREAEARRMAAATRAAGEQWDDWHDGALHCVRTLVEGEGDPTPPHPRKGGDLRQSPTTPLHPREGGDLRQPTPPSAPHSPLHRNDEGKRAAPGKKGASFPPGTLSQVSTRAARRRQNEGLRNRDGAVTLTLSEAAPGSTNPPLS